MTSRRAKGRASRRAGRCERGARGAHAALQGRLAIWLSGKQTFPGAAWLRPEVWLILRIFGWQRRMFETRTSRSSACRAVSGRNEALQVGGECSRKRWAWLRALFRPRNMRGVREENSRSSYELGALSCELSGCGCHRFRAEAVIDRSAWEELAMREGLMDAKVDAFLEQTKWRAEAERLRGLLLGCGLEEGWKWDKPCYMVNGTNVAVIQTMKESIALMFFQGALLRDEAGILAKMGAHTEVGRWIKFTSAKEIAKLEPVLKAYVFEAMEAAAAGLKVAKKPAAERKLPAELEAALAKSAKLREAFAGLTPGRQKGYAIAVSRGKKAETRVGYVKKFVPLILAGKGVDDDARAAYKAAQAKKGK